MSDPADDDVSANDERTAWEWPIDLWDIERLGSVRAIFRDFLTARTAADTDIVAAEIIIAELVGNVIRHAGGIATLRLDWSDPHPTLVVLDYGGGFRGPPMSTLDDPGAESGRGLALVQALALSCEVGNHHEGGAFVRVTLPVCRKPSGMAS
jgi:anti-sigma regulatory factor (Ser/Thr protein kinase)